MRPRLKGYRPLEEYEPKQRGMVGQAQRQRGNKLLADGDVTYDECPRCGTLLRVRRGKTGGPTLWCPCGYEIRATELEGE